MDKLVKAYSDEFVMSRIHVVRGLKVMLDSDLAQIYGVETKVLNQAVRRNAQRFPDDFLVKLTPEEAGALRSQTVTLKRGAHSKYLPHAFTEHGVLMLSNVLRSERAVLMSPGS
ncbi:MAG: ORF6N domain-containing protein [Flavobacteriales bacterium]